MNTKFFKVLMAVLIVSALCVGNSFAFDATARDDSSRVTVGQNYVGDALLGQIYQTQWNYQTKIKVINSADNAAVVARINFRTTLCSSHVFDFFIYLTPTDVWEGIVRVNDAGNVEIYSEDDSVMSSEQFEWDGVAACNPFKGTWASAEAPLHREFFTANVGAGDTLAQGHFEIVGVASFPATAPMSKDTLAMAYGNLIGVPGVDIAQLIACDYNLLGAAADCPNVLMGTITLENSFWKQKSSINMVALKNYNDVPVNTDTSVIVGLDGLTTKNSVPEIEACLAKDQYSVPFDFTDAGDSEVILVNTFPTLYLAASSGIFVAPCTAVCDVAYTVYDMQEKRLLSFLSGDAGRQCLPEVMMMGLTQNIQAALDNGYKEGWVNVAYPGAGAGVAEGGAAVTFAGVPSINSYITVSKTGDLDWNYAASPEVLVTYDGVAVRQ